MQIQNVNNIKFQATRVLTARSVKPTKSELIEVFRLNLKEDIDFIKKCNNLFSKNNRKPHSAFEKRFKSLFYDLQNKPNAASEEFYITVKNNEVISGCLNSLPFIKNIIPLNLFVRNKNSDEANILLYSLLKDSQKGYKNFDIKMDVLTAETFLGKGKIKADSINNVCNDIKEKTSNFKLRFENKKNINLDDVFATHCFETEFYPNLK